MTCPTPDALVPHALGKVDPTIARHVEVCVICQSELARQQEAASVLRAQSLFESRARSADCLDERAIGDLLGGRLTRELRAPLVAHLLACAHCRSILAATGRLLNDPQVAKEIPRPRRVLWQRWPLPLGLAAAAAVLLLLWPRSVQRSDSVPGMREPSPAATQAPGPIAPRGSVARVVQFVWSSVPGVDRYRVRLYDGEGGVVWTTETSDSVAVLPASVVPAAGSYFWKVEAQTEWGRWVGSDLTEFRLIGPRP